MKQINEGWEIIFQRAHGMLAAQIAFHLHKKLRPSRWVETLLAIAEHDDSQLDFSGKEHITASGAPLNFKMKDINLFQPKANSDHAFQKSRWINLLNSLHISFLYENNKGANNDLDKILEKEKKKQSELIRDLNITPKIATDSYRLLEWCDSLSLLLCQDLLQPEERKMEISKGANNIIHQIWQRKTDQSLVVEPWCFEQTSFEVIVESRVLSQLQFKDDAELKTKLLDANVKENTWTFRK